MFINRLIFESSPYLLQHAHNPVNWYAWGDDAFRRAEALDRPILLSVGYSTCHWCHVMERESFEDPEIAAYINRHFIPIKVDREERPDVDDVYMTVVQLMTGGGGWPMTVVMLPDRRPYFGGTYFPPHDGDRGARIGFSTVLQRLAEAYASERDRVVESASRLSQALGEATKPRPPTGMPNDRALVEAARWLARRYDPEHGGFGSAPKFPRPSTYELLMRYHRRSDDPLAEAMVDHSLRAMANGGIYDHVGGGFARYSTDDRWLVPHFEKMLYDNAQLLAVYVDAHQVTGRVRFAEVARDVADYVLAEMTHPEGGFYSATDADSEGEEGRFFVWSLDEIRRILSPDRARLFVDFFGVTETGNFEGKNVLHRTASITEFAARTGRPEDEIRNALEASRRELYAARKERVHPLLDDKIITAWNGQMLGALARAGFVLDEPRYVEAARRAARFVEAHLTDASGLLRAHRNGQAAHRGVLEDHAFFISGLLDLWEASGELRWLDVALRHQAEQDGKFWDEDGGGYYGTADDADHLLVRTKPEYDGAQPSGNSVAALNLLRLHLATADERFEHRAKALLVAFSHPLALGAVENPKMAQALDFLLDEPLEIVVATGEREAAGLVDVLRRTYVPNRVILWNRPGDDATEERLELARGKTARDGETTVYVCRNRVCDRPATDPDQLREQLAPSRPIEAAPLETRRR